MAVSIQKLKDRYATAHEALDNYGLTISSKLATGNTTKTMLEKFNLMTAWITFIGDKLPTSTLIPGVSPTSIVVPVPDIDENEDVTIGIENYKGEFVPIIVIYNYQFVNDYQGRSISQAIIENWNVNVDNFLNSPAAQSPQRKNIFVRRNSTGEVRIHFPETSDYNGQKLFVGNNVKNKEEFSNIIVRGGRSPVTEISTLPQDLISTYNSVLEDIAIELKISYTD